MTDQPAQQRNRLPTTRQGDTHKITVGPVSPYVTANRADDGTVRELFVKADMGWQGWADALAVTASMALQYGCPFQDILLKWRGMRFPPDGMQAFSIPDAIARRLGSDQACWQWSDGKAARKQGGGDGN